MKFARLMVLALVLANLGYFAWNRGAFLFAGIAPARFTHPETEPERLTQQVRPELLLIGAEIPLPAPVTAPAPESDAEPSDPLVAPAAEPPPVSEVPAGADR